MYHRPKSRSLTIKLLEETGGNRCNFVLCKDFLEHKKLKLYKKQIGQCQIYNFCSLKETF